MNPLDRLIGWVNPQAGLRRARARTAMRLVQRAYDGAKGGRLSSGWVNAGTSANTEIAAAATTLRNNARAFVRNSALARKAVEVIVANAVGTGIMPQARTGDARLDRQIMDAWAQFAATCDADGVQDFYGLTALAARSIVESGEVLGRFRARRADDGLAVPFQLQLLEPDLLDTARAALSGNNYINQGIEKDALGRRIAYWLFSQHPGEQTVSLRNAYVSARVPASEVLHAYRKDRPGQDRGVTWFAPIMVKLRDLDDYDEAELVRKKIEACFTAFVTQPEDQESAPIGQKSQGDGGRQVETFEPGMVEYLKPGQDIRFGEPKPTGGYGEYMRWQAHIIAAGLGVTYEQLTGDLSQVNYSSYRAGHLEFRRVVEAFRWHVLIPMFCEPVWRRFIDMAYAAGRIRRQHYGVEWAPPAFESVDPQKDAAANLAMVRSGEKTLFQVIAERGYDPQIQLQQIAETARLLDQLGLVLDSDPRKTSAAGLVQPQADGPSEGVGNAG